MVNRPAALLAIAVLIALPNGSRAAPPVSDSDRVHEIIGPRSGTAAPGCAVGIFEDGRTRFFDVGLADIGANRRFTPDTLVYAGSLAKQFTALAVMQLVVAGKLRLDDDVRKFLPELRQPRAVITLAMLLHHTAGVPNDAKLWPLAGYARPSAATRAESLQMLLGFPETNFPPGATFEYSNGGYELLSEVVERVSKTRFEDYVEDNVLLPLGMARSRILRGSVPKDGDLARGYVPDGSVFAPSEDLPMFGGAGGLLLTINDLARYHHDISSGHRVWTPAITKLMTQGAFYSDGSAVVLPVPGYHFGYAAGLMLSRDWLLHGGNFAGFQALFAWLPERGEAIALLCNRGDIQPPRLATRILAALRPQLPPVDAERYALPPLFGRFASDDLPAVYSLEPSGENLKITISGPAGQLRSTAIFKRVEERTFSSGAVLLKFDPDQRGFTVTSGPNTIRLHRFTQ